MSAPSPSRTVSVSIRRPPDVVYHYLSTVENFPRWSAFIRRVRREGEGWLFTTPGGEVRARFAPRNEFGVVDHQVTTPAGETVFVPLRVVPNGPEHSEVIFTVFRLPTMSDAQFEADVALVASDLKCLQRVLETDPEPGA